MRSHFYSPLVPSCLESAVPEILDLKIVCKTVIARILAHKFFRCYVSFICSKTVGALIKALRTSPFSKDLVKCFDSLSAVIPPASLV